jgi:uncharacterized membrane protein
MNDNTATQGRSPRRPRKILVVAQISPKWQKKYPAHSAGASLEVIVGRGATLNNPGAVERSEEPVREQKTRRGATPPEQARLFADRPLLRHGARRISGEAAMRVSALFAVPVVLCLAVPAALAGDAPKDIKGLYLLTDYPAVTALPGTTSTISLRLQNYGLAPERYQLSVDGVPQGWTATLLGGGQPVAAAMPAPDSSVALQLRLDLPKNAPFGTQTLTVKAAGQGNQVSLPVAVTLAKELPAKLAVEASLPSLRGTPKSSFDYTVKIKNDSGRNVTASFVANAPRNFETSWTEAYGTQQLSSIPIEAGQSKDVKLHVRPPSSIDAGTYPIAVTVTAEDATAKTDLSLEVVGQPQLTIAGRDGLMSSNTVAGEQRNVPVVVTNTGSAPADSIELSATAPTGWKIAFEPKTIERIAPGQEQEVQAQITPTAKSLAGDYMATVRASSRGETASAQFRVTVSTSTGWGMAGAGIIGAALLMMVGAVARFGRR